MPRIVLLLIALILMPCRDVPRRAVVGGAPVAAAATAVDVETVAGRRHFLRGYPAEDAGGVYAVIEIPAGTTAKFEVAGDGWLRWEHDRDDGRRREIDFLAYPVSYGMVPRTLAADGDALDLVVLGRGIERGRVVRTRVIGVLEMGDPGERDDKLIAVPVEPDLANGFTRLHDLDELDADYPGARTILALWFSYYWGDGATTVLGWGDAAEAARILGDAERAFQAGADGADAATRRNSSSSSSAVAICCARALTAAALGAGRSRLSMLSAITRIRTSPPSPAASTARSASCVASATSPRCHAQ